MNDLARRAGEVMDGLVGRSIGRRDRAVVIGAAVSAVWVLMVLVFWLAGPSDAPPMGGLARLASIVGVVLPLILIWIAVGLAQAIAALRAEARALRARVEVMRGGDPARPDPVPATPGLASAAAARASARPAVRPSDTRAPDARTESRQTDLPFEQSAPEPVPPEALVAALNFPDGPDDHAAIAALRTALADPDTARAIRAAQDVITLLASHGIYMDDLDPTPAPPEIWRRFAAGQRGPAVAGLGTIDDAAALDLAGALMRGDEVFRDAAHHFLRQYDRMLVRADGQMNDDGLAALAATRSGRAFTLLAQVTGMFG